MLSSGLVAEAVHVATGSYVNETVVLDASHCFQAKALVSF